MPAVKNQTCNRAIGFEILDAREMRYNNCRPGYGTHDLLDNLYGTQPNTGFCRRYELRLRSIFYFSVIFCLQRTRTLLKGRSSSMQMQIPFVGASIQHTMRRHYKERFFKAFTIAASPVAIIWAHKTDRD